MGREASITREQVNAVADSIKAQGGKPSLRAVRERLGSGSLGTVSKYLQEWKDGQELQGAVNLTLPPLLQRALLEFMQAEVSAARAPLESEIAEQQQVTSDLATENERQAETIESQAAEGAELAAEKAAVEGRAEQLAADLAAEKVEVLRERQAAELARTELAKAQLRLEAMPRLEADLEEARAELKEVREARVAAEQKAAVLQAQKSDLEGRLDDAKKELFKAGELLQKSQERAEASASALSDARINEQGQRNRLADLTEQLKKAQEKAEQLNEDLSGARASVKSLEAVKSEQATYIATLEAERQSSQASGDLKSKQEGGTPAPLPRKKTTKRIGSDADASKK